MRRARTAYAQALVALAAGLVFGAGLVVSGMTRPTKVIGFLDVFGAWDASLMFVMMGAIGVHFVAYRIASGTTAPLFGDSFGLPTRREIDRKLLLGAAVFGIGWGLAGYCPGPAVTSLSSGTTSVLVFVVAMLVGLFGMAKLEGALARGRLPAGEAQVEKHGATTS